MMIGMNSAKIDFLSAAITSERVAFFPTGKLLRRERKNQKAISAPARISPGTIPAMNSRPIDTCPATP